MSNENVIEVRMLVDSIPTDPETGCKLWTKGKSSNGYPVKRFVHRVRNTVIGADGGVEVKKQYIAIEKVHRLVYQYLKLAGARIPPDYYVIQTCGNKACVNPEHLVTIRNGDLRKQIAAKTKEKRLEEEVREEIVKESRYRNMQTKLARQTILDIYNSELSTRKTAQEYGVSAVTVNNIRTGKIHTTITGGFPYAKDSAKLNEDAVRAIRGFKGKMSLKELAKLYDVHTQTISNVWTGRSHKDIK